MRKITRQSIAAFNLNEDFKKGNTEVRNLTSLGQGVMLLLHGNIIAHKSEGKVFISTCGWDTPTTKERLNAVYGVSVYTRKGQLYLNGEKWDGEKVEIK